MPRLTRHPGHTPYQRLALIATFSHPCVASAASWIAEVADSGQSGPPSAINFPEHLLGAKDAPSVIRTIVVSEWGVIVRLQRSSGAQHHAATPCEVGRVRARRMHVNFVLHALFARIVLRWTCARSRPSRRVRPGRCACMGVCGGAGQVRLGRGSLACPCLAPRTCAAASCKHVRMAGGWRAVIADADMPMAGSAVPQADFIEETDREPINCWELGTSTTSPHLPRNPWSGMKPSSHPVGPTQPPSIVARPPTSASNAS